MWNRVEFKRRGRAAFLANFFRCVIVALIVGLVTTGARASGRAAGENQGNQTIQSGTLAPGITYDLSSNQPEQVQQLENELAQYMPGNYLSTFLLIGGGILLQNLHRPKTAHTPAIRRVPAAKEETP